VLRHVLYFTQVLSLGTSKSFDNALESSSVFWKKAGLEIKGHRHSKDDLKNLYEEWNRLRKTNKERREGNKYKTNVELFMKKMEEGFDMGGENQ
jgi:hypothetical protein